MDPNPHQHDQVVAREDVWEAAQCPACHMYIGVYVISPSDPNIDAKLYLIPPDEVQKVVADVKQRWADAAEAMAREQSQ